MYIMAGSNGDTAFHFQVGFGKGTPSKTLWLDGIDPIMSESQLERQISKFGEVVKIGVDRFRCCAMVQYDSMETAKEALNSIKGTYIGSSTIPCMVSIICSVCVCIQ